MKQIQWCSITSKKHQGSNSILTLKSKLYLLLQWFRAAYITSIYIISISWDLVISKYWQGLLSLKDLNKLGIWGHLNEQLLVLF